MKSKNAEVGFVELMRKLQHAGLRGASVPNSDKPGLLDLPSLEERLKVMFNLVKQEKRIAGNMLFFVMYDIQSSKVRNQIAKYLIKNGCFRIQKSIFLADVSSERYQQIRSDLTEVQACYENNDSILIVPISTDYLNSMKVIGQTIDVDLITHNRNTLFF